jgi:hypothetical protein
MVNDIRRISNISLVIVLTTILPSMGVSCSGHGTTYIQSDAADTILLYDWNEGDRGLIRRDSDSEREQELKRQTPMNFEENDHHSGYCTNPNISFEEEDLNFYDGDSYFGDGDEISDEERYEIDELYEE